MEPSLSWLCPTLQDRERFLDMQERLGLARVVTIFAGALVGTTLALSAGSVWGVLAATAAMIAGAVVGGWHLDRRRRPELWVFASTVVNIQVMLAIGIVLTGGPRSPLVYLIALPVVMVATRFSTRGLAVGAPVSALLIVATTVGVDAGYVAGHPGALVVPLALVLCISVYMRPVVASDIRHRADSRLDELTGLLNRRGLEERFAEVSEQAALSRRPVSLVLADIDHFKRVNDDHGHATGDAVLREVALEMRRNLRTFELLYRVGGEEFLLLLPGADAEAAAAVAETLRAAVEALRPLGLSVACSFGVATTRDEVALATLTGAADAALYAAKREGRNRVEQPASAVAAVA